MPFALPGTLKVITWPNYAVIAADQAKYIPIYDAKGYVEADGKHEKLNFVMLDCFNDGTSINDFTYLDELANDKSVVLCLSSKNAHAMPAVRRVFMELMNKSIKTQLY